MSKWLREINAKGHEIWKRTPLWVVILFWLTVIAAVLVFTADDCSSAGQWRDDIFGVSQPCPTGFENGL